VWASYPSEEQVKRQEMEQQVVMQEASTSGVTSPILSGAAAIPGLQSSSSSYRSREPRAATPSVLPATPSIVPPAQAAVAEPEATPPLKKQRASFSDRLLVFFVFVDVCLQLPQACACTVACSKKGRSCIQCPASTSKELVA
jgi:hypothetical protein